jgi:photosystem II stability/assembly factor-like uncharacterized protein
LKFNILIMKRESLLVFGSLMIVNALIGQHWLQKSNDLNFYQIQEKFNTFWDDRTYEKGKGYKQFKRWEYFMEQRVYPQGKIPNSAIVFDEFKKFKKQESTSNALQKSNGSWQPIETTSWIAAGGWNPGLGRVNVITVDPANDSIIYIGTPAGGLWKSVDNGGSWIPLTDKLPILGVSAVAIDPTNSDIIYIGTGDSDGGDTYGVGILKSIDGGLTWEVTGLVWDLEIFRKTTKIVINSQNTNVVIAATNQGLWRTENAGLTWEMVRNGDFRDLEIDPLEPNNVYAANDAFHKSTDGGITFDFVTEGLPVDSIVNRYSIALCESEPSVVYALAGNHSDDSYNGLYKSEDYGINFTLQSSTPNIFSYATDGNEPGGQSWYDMALAVSPTDPNTIYAAGINVWKSTNSGQNWTIVSHWLYPSGYGYTHADVHTLDVFNETLYCGSDGGVFKSTDQGNNWGDISEGLQISQFYRMSISEQNPYKILLGAQDNGMNLVNDSVYSHLLGGDGNGAVIDYSDDNIMYTVYQLGSIQKSINGGLSFGGIENGEQGDGNWVTPFVLDPFDHTILYAGYRHLWKFDSNIEEWEQISSVTSNNLDCIEASPASEGTIYISSYSSIFRTDNGGVDWINISSGIPDLFITSIESDPLNASKVWVTLSGYEDGYKVYVSEDGGETWENISANLPNIPAVCIAFQEGENEGIYVGTDAGVYYKDNTLPEWITYMDGLPNVIVNQLKVDLPNDRIVACTFGRGVWESDLYEFTPSGTASNNISTTNLFSIYPIPADGTLNIKINGDLNSENLNIELIDLTGKTIKKKFFSATTKNILSFNLNDVENGAYFLKINFDNKSVAKKLIVQKSE